MKASLITGAFALLLLAGCEGGENARKTAAVFDDSQKGVVTAPGTFPRKTGVERNESGEIINVSDAIPAIPATDAASMGTAGSTGTTSGTR